MSTIEEIRVPNIGDFKAVEVIDVLVKQGDQVNLEDPLITLETEKAAMDIPSPKAGQIESILVKAGDKVSEGDVIVKLKSNQAAEEAVSPAEQTQQASAPKTNAPQADDQEAVQAVTPAPVQNQQVKETPQTQSTLLTGGDTAHAGPATRKFARALGVDLAKVTGSGKRGRITTPDVEQYVKSALQRESTGVANGSGIPAIPEQDFSQFGEIEPKPLSRIKKLTARNMSRNWLNIPHVTQFDAADITDLEVFRKENKQAALENGIQLTPLSFIVKAVIAALKALPQFNASLSGDGETLIYKKYYHIGIAVDTPNGLLVPVIKNADAKGLFEIAKEMGELSEKARNGQLKAAEMQGNTFTISSLGSKGGTQFTPIINAPDVAILGVSRLDTKPVWQDNQFVPRQMLPLALSYDHRVIDGVEGAKFMAHVCAKLQDIRKLLL